MARWLVKTEPGEFSWQDLETAGRAVWDGVRNPTALRNLRAMVPGDGVLVYHSGAVRAVIGLATVAAEPYPDPKVGDPRFVAVDLTPVRRLAHAVPLSALKAEGVFDGSPLLRQGRLSVVPLTEEQWRRVMELGGVV